MRRRDIGGAAALTVYLLCVGLLTGPSFYQLIIGRLPQPRLELIPFVDIIKVVTDTESVGAGVFANLAGNVLMFAPLGLLLPLFWSYFRRAKRTVLCGLLLSVSIELIQLVAGGVTSVDDVLLNTLGTAVGFGCAALFLRGKRGRGAENHMSWCWPLISWIIVIIFYTAMDCFTLRG